MMNRGYSGKQLKGRGAPRLSGRAGVIPDKAKRQPTETGGSTPAKNVQGSGSRNGAGMPRGAMASHEGACGKAGGHLMGKG